MVKKRKLVARWNKRERDIVVDYPTRKVHANVLLHAFTFGEPGLVKQLEDMGYDITSLRFSITLKEE